MAWGSVLLCHAQHVHHGSGPVFLSAKWDNHGAHEAAVRLTWDDIYYLLARMLLFSYTATTTIAQTAH